MRGTPPPSLRSPTSKLPYLVSLLSGDRERADEAVEEAARTSGLRRTYLEVLAPSQIELGEMWLRDEINVAEHHRANQIMAGHLDRLSRTLPARELRGRAVTVVSLAGEHHTFGARLVADFLRFDGFTVDFLGGDTPTPDLIDFARQKQPDLVGISVTLKENLAAARKCVAGLKALAAPPRVLCGGVAVHSAFGEKGLPEADGFGKDAAQAVRAARRLLGLDETARSLENYLTVFGTRVRELRKSRGWNQEHLAREADLDRSYVSSVENGKHNLTLSVALRLAKALEVPVDWLLG